MQDTADTRDFLRCIAVFGGLTDDGLRRVISLLEERACETGTVVVRHGETGRSIYVVRDGDVIVRRPGPSGALRKVVRLGKGEFFGETSLVEIHPSDVTVTADRASKLYLLSNKALYSLYREDPAAYLMVVTNIARELSRRLRKAEARVCELAEQIDEDDRTQIGPG